MTLVLGCSCCPKGYTVYCLLYMLTDDAIYDFVVYHTVALPCTFLSEDAVNDANSIYKHGVPLYIHCAPKRCHGSKLL